MFGPLPFTDAPRRAGARHVGVAFAAPLDLCSPAAAYHALRRAGEPSALLDFQRPGGRVAIVAVEPLARIESDGSRARRIDHDNRETPVTGDILAALRALQAEYRLPAIPDAPPLAGALLGFAGYDFARRFETLPDQHAPESPLPELAFAVYRTLLAFDCARQRLFVLRLEDAGGGPAAARHRGLEQCRELLARARQASLPLPPATRAVASALPARADLHDDAFATRVSRAQEHIRAGDCFQIVLSRTFSAPCETDPLDVYRALEITSPAPYRFLFERAGAAVAGASPETLIQLHDGMLETAPIAGTRPLPPGGDAAALGRELLADPKEMAEHAMLVDLARNDLGRLAQPGSVTVPEMARPLALSRVVHLRSRVTARLQAGRDALDCLAAALPAGTLSGAPKIRAMQLIDGLECSRRGLYGGAVAILDTAGNLDSAIAIRMVELRGGRALVRAGAGVVADSDPHREANETRHKAAAALQAVALSQGEPACCS